MKTRMAIREEHTTKCSSTSSCARGGRGWEGGDDGGDSGSDSKRCSKKLKQKKIPQRGLGVAQLEKLRLAEQQKREAAESSVGIFSPNHKVFALDSSSNIAHHQCQNPILPLDILRQRSLQNTTSSMVNASSGISPLPSVMNFPTEPPSNQSYYGNNYSPFCPHDRKPTVFQRQYPFPSKIPPASPFHNRLPSTFVSQSMRSAESSMYSHDSLADDLQGAYSIIRGSSSSGRTISGKDCLEYDYGFLTLAPPNTAANQELPRTTEECLEDPARRQQTRESSGGSYGQQFFCFLPTPNLENDQKITSENNCSRSQTVDLSLKL